MTLDGSNTPWDCPPGYECDTSSYTICQAGHYSERETNTCTEKDWLYQSDMEGNDCPTEGMREADRLRCQMSELDYTNAAPSTATACVQADSDSSWYGYGCEQCETGAAKFSTACTAMEFAFDIECAPGK